MISIQQYRACIGLFCHGRPKQHRGVQTLLISKTKVSLSIRVMLFSLLALCQCVESHPGPASLTPIVNSLTEKVERLEGIVNTMEKKIQKMSEQNTLLSQACLNLEEKCERLESQGRRDNVLIHNLAIKEGGGETWSESEEKAKEHFKSMGITEEIDIERAHRLNTKKPNSPVIVRLRSYKQKEKIMEKAKQIKKERRERNQQSDENQVYVNEDFTFRVRKARALLRPGLIDAINDNKRAYISYDKLVIEGKHFWFDESKKVLSENKPTVMCCSELNNKLSELL